MESANQDHTGIIVSVEYNIVTGTGKDDLQWSLRGPFERVHFRRGNSEFQAVNFPPEIANYLTDDFSVQGDVSKLNRYFDDIKRFLIQRQSADLAHQELDKLARRYQTTNRRDMRAEPPSLDPNGILHFLHMKTQLPSQPEFVDIFRKFKLSFNLLAKLRNHIHEPVSALLQFLFIALELILNACHWELGRNIAPRILTPLLSLEACKLMRNCLTRKETVLWMSLGEAWRTPPEEWAGLLLAPIMIKTAL